MSRGRTLERLDNVFGSLLLIFQAPDAVLEVEVLHDVGRVGEDVLDEVVQDIRMQDSLAGLVCELDAREGV